MVETFRRSYRLFTESLHILRQDKELLIFPILSGLFTMIALAGMVFGGVITGFFQRLAESDRSLEGNILGYAALFVWYFVSWFIVLFFNVAIIHCAKMRLDGGDPTVADGFRAAMTHLSSIAVWALVSATVGLVLRVVAERGKIVGKIVSSILGAGWAIATYFIVPVMIFEKRSIRDSVKQSTSLIRKTWGESVVTAGGVGVFVMLLGVAGLLLPVAGLFISPMAAAIGLGLMVVYWLGLSILSAALTGILRTSLYLYATDGRVPPGITAGYVENAFAPKGGKGAVRLGTA